MEHMEHMKMKWRVEAFNGKILIQTVEEEPWVICEVSYDLPNDKSGELTANAIVEAHNEGLENQWQTREEFEQSGYSGAVWVCINWAGNYEVEESAYNGEWYLRFDSLKDCFIGIMPRQERPDPPCLDG